jgi:hypothetical protein
VDGGWRIGDEATVGCNEVLVVEVLVIVVRGCRCPSVAGVLDADGGAVAEGKAVASPSALARGWMGVLVLLGTKLIASKGGGAVDEAGKLRRITWRLAFSPTIHGVAIGKAVIAEVGGMLGIPALANKVIVDGGTVRGMVRGMVEPRGMVDFTVCKVGLGRWTFCVFLHFSVSLEPPMHN